MEQISSGPRDANGFKGVPTWLLAAGIPVFLLLVVFIQPRLRRPSFLLHHPEAIDASELVKAYATNEIAADQQFKGKRIQIVGEVAKIGKNVFSGGYVTIGGSGVRDVTCDFEDRDITPLSQFRDGDTIVIDGECNGLMLNVFLKDCKVIDSKR